MIFSLSCADKNLHNYNSNNSYEKELENEQARVKTFDQQLEAILASNGKAQQEISQELWQQINEAFKDTWSNQEKAKQSK